MDHRWLLLALTVYSTSLIWLVIISLGQVTIGDVEGLIVIKFLILILIFFYFSVCIVA